MITHRINFHDGTPNLFVPLSVVFVAPLWMGDITDIPKRIYLNPQEVSA